MGKKAHSVRRDWSSESHLNSPYVSQGLDTVRRLPQLYGKTKTESQNIKSIHPGVYYCGKIRICDAPVIAKCCSHWKQWRTSSIHTTRKGVPWRAVGGQSRRTIGLANTPVSILTADSRHSFAMYSEVVRMTKACLNGLVKMSCSLRFLRWRKLRPPIRTVRLGLEGVNRSLFPPVGIFDICTPHL